MSGGWFRTWTLAVWSVTGLALLVPKVVAQAGSGARPRPARAVLVLDVAGNGISLTTTADGVSFDHGDGRPSKTAWTRQGSDDAFIVVELQQNGVVEGLRELAGGDGPPNGFDYFRVLKRANRPRTPATGTGVLESSTMDARDAVFPRVLLWTDTNHNGISEPLEMQSFAYAGFESIDLNTEKVDVPDASGSRVREKGTAILKTRGGNERRNIIAVELARDQPRDQ